MNKLVLLTAIFILGSAQAHAGVRFIVDTDWSEFGFIRRINKDNRPADPCEGYKYKKDNCPANKVLSAPCSANPKLYKDCACPEGLVDREEWAKILGVSDFFFNTGSDICVKLQNCEELGYTQKASQCPNGALRCPYDKTMAFCN